MSPATVEKRRAVLINVAYIALVLGAFYLFVKAPNGVSGTEFYEAGKRFELLLVPSDSFGVEGYVRVAYCVSEDTIRRSLPAFKKLAELYSL